MERGQEQKHSRARAGARQNKEALAQNCAQQLSCATPACCGGNSDVVEDKTLNGPNSGRRIRSRSRSRSRSRKRTEAVGTASFSRTNAERTKFRKKNSGTGTGTGTGTKDR